MRRPARSSTRSRSAAGPPMEGVSSDGTHVWVTNPAKVRSVRSKRRPARSSTRSRSAANPRGVVGWHPRLGHEPRRYSQRDRCVDRHGRQHDPGRQRPGGVSSDGTHVWVTNYGEGTISEIPTSYGETKEEAGRKKHERSCCHQKDAKKKRGEEEARRRSAQRVSCVWLSRVDPKRLCYYGSFLYD